MHFSLVSTSALHGKWREETLFDVIAIPVHPLSSQVQGSLEIKDTHRP